jgi:ankyrin repeat protein
MITTTIIKPKPKPIFTIESSGLEQLPINTKGAKFITRIHKPKSDNIPRKVTFLQLTHHLTSNAPKQPNMDSVRRFCEFNRMIDLNIGDQGNKERSPGNTTALMHAAIYGFEELVAYYLELGADPLLKSTSGTTALDRAKKFKYTKIINMLENAERLWKRNNAQ